MMTLSLDGQWQMKEVNAETWNEALVPGSVCMDLLRACRMKDPFYGENEHAARELFKNDYEYKREFQVSGELLRQEKIFLICEGIDTLAELYINNRLLAKTADMHRRWQFEIKDLLMPGKNEIHILLRSPVRYAAEKNAGYPLRKAHGAMEGAAHLRKAHYMFGWDWAPQIPDAGVWRSIGITACSGERLGGIAVSQNHQPDSVELDVRIGREIFTPIGTEIACKLSAPDGTVLYDRTVEAVSEETRVRIPVENPLLWWPNGYGKQYLYHLEISLISGGSVTDGKSMNIGLRTIRVEQEKDRWGRSFSIVVNGVPVFAKGADYIPQDSIIPRITKEKAEKLVADCARANFNCLRVWGGGFYPDDFFYDLCDRYGMLVWQDLMFACMLYHMTDDFTENITAETTDNIRRIRHHACLALWCGNNEISWLLDRGSFSEVISKDLRIQFFNQFYSLLPKLVRENDPATFFWDSSPSSGSDSEDPNEQQYGDMHYWEVWHDAKPFSAYYDVYPRFMSEFGLQSFPGMKTVKTFTAPEDRNIFSPVMENHQKNEGCNAKILQYVADNFRYPGSLELLIYASQLIQAEGIRCGVEHWRRNSHICRGVIYWQLNDCWPVASWSSIDYFGRWKALHYFAKRFFSPVMLSAKVEDKNIDFYLVNDTLSEFKGTAQCRLFDQNGKLQDFSSWDIQVEPLKSSRISTVDYSQKIDTVEKRRGFYAQYLLKDESGVLVSSTIEFESYKHFTWKDPEISIGIEDRGDRFILRLKSSSLAKFVEVDFNDIDPVLSDNYFDIIPGDVKEIEILKADLPGGISAADLKSRIAVKSLYDLK